MRLFGRRRPETGRTRLLRAMPRDSVCAEIGVHLGDFSAEILEVVRPRRLHLIDPWRYESAETYAQSWYGGTQGGSQATMDARHAGVVARFRDAIDAGRVAVHRADSAAAAREFPDAYFDWVYIDGNHQYEFARADLDAYAAKVRPGGCLTGDDYADGGWWEGGVRRAVDEFVAAGRGSLVSVDEKQFVLRVPG
jgi:methyltransferase family protein